MAKFYPIFIWKKAPFLRLLVPVISGIILEHYSDIQINEIILSSILTLVFFIASTFMPEAIKYRFRWLQGILLSMLLILFGLFITWQKDARNHSRWYGQYYNDSSSLIATINEPIVEKAKSYKALATVESCINNGLQRNASGNLILYFAKDSFSKQLKYGDKIIFGKTLQSIKNSGNPGSFNYSQYLAFQNIFHQCYLQKNDWIILKGRNTSASKTHFQHSRLRRKNS